MKLRIACLLVVLAVALCVGAQLAAMPIPPPDPQTPPVRLAARDGGCVS